MQKIPTSPTTPLVKNISITRNELSRLHLELLKNGDELSAKVLSRGTKGEIKLQIGEVKLTALTLADVMPGDIVKLKVVKAGQQIQLQFIATLKPSGTTNTKTTQPSAPVTNSKAVPDASNLIKVISIEPGKSLKANEQYTSKVISSDRSGVVKLKVGSTVIEGRSPKVLEVGQQIQIKSLSNGSKIQLQIMPSVQSISKEGMAKEQNLPLSQIRLLNVDIVKHAKQGDIIQAKVIANNSKGELSLKIGDLVTKVLTAVKLPVNKPIYLKVIKAEGEAILETLTPKEHKEQIKLDALRKILPRQQALGPGIQKLLDVEQGRTAELPQSVKESIVAILKQQPTPERLNLPSGLRQALVSSGLFSEPRLLAGLPVLTDLKVGLNQLIAQIRPMLQDSEFDAKRDILGARRVPLSTAQGAAQVVSSIQLGMLDELLRNSDSAVARIQAQQLASVPQDDSKHQVWHFELPILSGDKIEQINIEIDKGDPLNEEHSEIPWQITLQMNLTPLGEMRVQLKLNACSISTIFWAEEQETLSLLNKNIPTLKDALDKAGFDVNEMRVLHGLIKRRESDALIPENASLLSVKV